jgi:class 3 adenylate cyclase
MREPAHVFTLLETIYFEFDQVALRRGVFKVETVGDCYVAVCGLPEPRQDHAVIMVSVFYDVQYFILLTLALTCVMCRFTL